MKIFNAYSLIALTALASLTNSLQTETTTIPQFAKVLETWDEKDVQQFLKDRNIKYDVPTPTEKEKDSTMSIDHLKSLAAQEVGKLYDASNNYENMLYDKVNSWKDNLNGVKQNVLSYVWPNSGYISEKVSRSYSYLTQQLDPTSYFGGTQSLSDWIFDTWSVDQLQHTLKANKIKFKSGATRQKLISLAKENYDKISKNSNASGRYPGDWLFESWSTKDLSKWLHDNNLAVSKKFNKDREYLLKQVRENIYPASVDAKEAKDELFESLNLPSLDDLGNNVQAGKDELMKKWSESQLMTWLNYHGVEISEKLKGNKDELMKMVKKNKSLLDSDITEWKLYAKSKASEVKDKAADAKDALLEKVPSDAGNLVNDTFLVDVEKWPKERLKAFLTSRGISIPLFATKKDLVKLVKKNKSKGLMDLSKIAPASIFTGWSTEKLKDWLQSNKVEAEGYRDELVEKASDLYKHLQKENFYKEQAKDLVYTAADLVNAAKDNAVDYGVKGKKLADKAYDDYKEPVGELLNTAGEVAADLLNSAKDTAVEYGVKGRKLADKVYDEYKEPVGEMLNTAKEKAGEAAQATKEYGAGLFDYLSSWSNEDLKNYLRSFGVKNTDSLEHEDLLSKAKRHTLSFFGGDQGWFGSKPVPKKSVWSSAYWKDLYLGMRGY